MAIAQSRETMLDLCVKLILTYQDTNLQLLLAFNLQVAPGYAREQDWETVVPFDAERKELNLIIHLAKHSTTFCRKNE